MVSNLGVRVLLASFILVTDLVSSVVPSEPPSLSMTGSFRSIDGNYLPNVAASDLTVTEDQRPGGKIIAIESMIGVSRQFCIAIGRNHAIEERLEFQKALAQKFLREVVQRKSDTAVVFTYNVRTVEKLSRRNGRTFEATIAGVRGEGGRPDTKQAPFSSGFVIDGRSGGLAGSWYRQLMNGVYSRGNLVRFTEAAYQVSDGGAGMALAHCAAWFEEQKSPSSARFVVLFADDQWGTAIVPAQMANRMLQMEAAQFYAFGFNEGTVSKPSMNNEPEQPQRHLNHVLQFIASGTGGAAYFASGAVHKEKLPSLESVRDQFNALKRVIYVPTRSAQNGSDPHSLNVEYLPDKLVRVSLPTAFYPPSMN